MKKIELPATPIPADEAEEIIKADYSALIAAIDAFLNLPLILGPPQPKD